MWILNSISVRLCQCFTDSSLSSWSGRDESQDRLLFRSLHFQILCNSTQELCDQSLEDEMFWCDDRTNQCSVQVHSTIIHQAGFYHLVTLTRSQLVFMSLVGLKRVFSWEDGGQTAAGEENWGGLFNMWHPEGVYSSSVSRCRVKVITPAVRCELYSPVSFVSRSVSGVFQRAVNVARGAATTSCQGSAG